MTKVQKSNKAATKEIRWVARAGSLLVVGLFALFLLESGTRVIPALSWNNPREMPLFLALCLAVAGVTVAWRLQAIGGFMAVAGAVAIVALAYQAAGPGLLVAAIFLSLPMFIAGVLHLLCSAMTWALSHAQRPRSLAARSDNRLAAV